ncbi:excalibur calcium-binding domain-containing protein [Paeniglutamicibacter sp. ABSL32-1]|nr:excalibur calcium-binding domain-containing protein [Paeniglutamicibacter quisquiliarum]
MPEGSRLSYQWLRGGQPVARATRTTYRIQASDLDQSISVRVTGSLGSVLPVARQSAPKSVGECLLPAIKAPVLIGGKTTDSTLISKLAVPAGVSTSYQWLRSGKRITSASKSSYKLTVADVGKRIQSRVSLTKAGYKSQLLSSIPVSVSKATIKNTKRASIAGRKSYGQTLKVSAGKYSVSPTSYGYQWHRNGKKIKGATKSALKMSATDIGKNISVTVRASRPGYHSTSSTTTASKISLGKIVPKSLPKISGKAKSGSVLSVSNGTWSPRASTYSYQWYRNGKKIKAANKRTYKVVAADRGKKISSRVSVSRKNHAKASASSNSVQVAKPTAKPKPKPPVNRAPTGGYANCTAVRNADAAPIYYGDPGYHSRLDRDGDGVGCE